MRRNNKALGQSMLEEGMLTGEQLKEAQDEERRSGQNIRKVVVRLGLIEEDRLISFLSQKLGVPRIDLENYMIDSKLTALVPQDLARKYELVPVLKIGNRLTCAMVDPWNVMALDELRMQTNLTIEPAVATESEIRSALDQYYGQSNSIQKVIKSTVSEGSKPEESRPDTEMDLEKIVGNADEPSVKKIVNMTLMNAIQDGASDIHLEPEEREVKIRFRVDGILRHAPSLPKDLQQPVTSRIKIIANMDITERRMAQDGRFNTRVGGRDIDVRVSCIPTIWGENVVMRLLDTSGKRLKLSQLGFGSSILRKYESLIKRPHGIMLVTGPTGSGKTTTLYSSLSHIHSVEKNIITIEDPVEYRLPGIRQVQVNDKAKLSFANGLRSLLRQDPDIIMVGEIRDPETAKIAVNAAQTGHLVLSTLHTNDSAGAATRLVDMGVEPFLIASSLLGVLAQRLVRLICPDCKEEIDIPQDTAEHRASLLKLEGLNRKGFRGKGCSHCQDSGYKGRGAIFELLVVNDKIRDRIIAKSSSNEIRKAAIESGMVTLQQSGFQKTLEGVTSVEEILRVSREE